MGRGLRVFTFPFWFYRAADRAVKFVFGKSAHMPAFRAADAVINPVPAVWAYIFFWFFHNNGHSSAF